MTYATVRKNDNGYITVYGSLLEEIALYRPKVDETTVLVNTRKFTELNEILNRLDALFQENVRERCFV